MYPVVAILFAILTFAPASVFACSCVGLPDTEEQTLQMAAGADVIFAGTVQETVIRYWVSGAGQEFEMHARISVVEAFKGTDGSDEVVLWSHPPTCNARFDLLKTYLFFASKSESDGRLYTGSCSSYRYEPRDPANPPPSWPTRGTIMQVIWTLRSLVE